MKKIFLSAILAGAVIAFGGTVFLSVENTVVGSLFFTIGLFVVCTRGLHLFTGKVCYVFDNDAAYAKTAWRGMKTRAITGLSIGYYVRESNYDEKTRIRTLTKLDLVEISIVTVPANDDARIDVIKSKLSHGDLPSLPEFEKFLREAGFSKSQSAAVASRGLSYLLDRSESGGEDGETKAAIAAMRQQLSQFSLPKIL